MTEEDLCYLSATEMAAAIATREVSCVEVARAVIERIESLEPRINAFSAFTPDLALKSAERHAKASMAEIKVKAEVTAIRTKHWFEKFNWFVSSDGLIVVCVKEAQQNDMLVRRYLRKDDIYVHW